MIRVKAGAGGGPGQHGDTPGENVAGTLIDWLAPDGHGYGTCGWLVTT